MQISLKKKHLVKNNELNREKKKHILQGQKQPTLNWQLTRDNLGYDVYKPTEIDV